VHCEPDERRAHPVKVAHRAPVMTHGLRQRNGLDSSSCRNNSGEAGDWVLIQFCRPSECVGRGDSRLHFLDRGGPSSSAPTLLLIRPLGELAPCASPASDGVCALQTESSRRSEGTNTRTTIWTVQGSMFAGDDGKLMIQRQRGCGPHARRRR